ncbi:helix-turn-helix domain-containing protein [Actinacidiphila epipremni]|uniref:Helix-turn-helix transcriptional regulator n=1 Tax=Actinacidiphila epipremni TaxID=2053013 RepID=A0ABX0ZKR9_9ACTN|nr:helix-turn-helix domain-containing protein [Actinacidiphila epipremni]NJP42256.1 helix-turn-helix transcriptional regulator [Actinacidiphila epipremni]
MAPVSADPRPDWVLARRAAIGHHIACLRAARGMSIDDLAEAAGVDRKTVIRAEGATVSTGLDLLLMIAAGLGVSAGQLLDGAPPRT